MKGCTNIFKICPAKTGNGWVERHQLLILLSCSLVASIALGSVLSGLNEHHHLPEWVLKYLPFPGEVLMRLLTMIVVPLTMTSLVSTLTSVDFRSSKLIVIRSISYFLLTTILASSIGVSICFAISPGAKLRQFNNNNNSVQLISKTGLAYSTGDAAMDLVRSILIFAKFENRILDHYKSELPKVEDDHTGHDEDEIDDDEKINVNLTEIEDGHNVNFTQIEGANLLSLAVISTVLGLAMSRRKSECRTAIEVVNSIEIVTNDLAKIAISFFPHGMFFIVATQIGQFNLETEDAAFVAYYILMSGGCVIFHGLVILPLFYFSITRLNPFRIVTSMLPAIVASFGTASSIATMPITLNCLEENVGISRRVSRFVIPLGSVVNMDGVALYLACGSVFIAQYRHVDLSAANALSVITISTVASICAAGLPNTAKSCMVIVLAYLGVSPKDAALVMFVDWVIDRFLAPLNIMSDCYGAAVVQFLSGNEIKQIPQKDDANDDEDDEMIFQV